MKINLDSPLMEFLGRVADLMILNLLFLLCCAPVITAGPALSALYSVSMRQARHEEGYIAKPFMRAFLKNFRKSFLISCIYAAVGALLVYGFGYWRGADGAAAMLPAGIRTAALAVLCAAAAGTVLSLIYVFALTARFENSVAGTVRNALILAAFDLKETALLVLIWAGVILLLIFTKACWAFMATIGFAAVAYLQSVLFVRVFSKYEKGE